MNIIVYACDMWTFVFQEEKKDDLEEVQTEKTSTDKEHDAKSDTSDEEKVKVIIFGGIFTKYITNWFPSFELGSTNIIFETKMFLN